MSNFEVDKTTTVKEVIDFFDDKQMLVNKESSFNNHDTKLKVVRVEVDEFYDDALDKDIS